MMVLDWTVCADQRERKDNSQNVGSFRHKREENDGKERVLWDTGCCWTTELFESRLFLSFVQEVPGNCEGDSQSSLLMFQNEKQIDMCFVVILGFLDICIYKDRCVCMCMNT